MSLCNELLNKKVKLSIIGLGYVGLPIAIAFAKKLKNISDSGQGVITFVIGGSYGLDDSVKTRADSLISFSDMTFPHTFFRVMLTEQLYRAFCINSGVSYHK